MRASTIWDDGHVRLIHGDALEAARSLPDESVRAIVTSPPYYGLRDYGEDGQYGAEGSLAEYVDRMVTLFRELRRVLVDDGTLWLNLGDSYASSGMTGVGPNASVPAKNLLGVPWRVAFALQDDGWILRSDIVWAKPNPMPESVRDRPTKAHEYLFMFAKRPTYHYDADAIAEVSSGSDHRRTVLAGQPSLEPSGGIRAPHTGLRTSEGRDRPQLKRAWEKFRAAGLTDAHMAAMRAVGMNDAGKAQAVQSGFGKNDPDVQRLADEAKTALGGYYREFLSGGTVNKRTVWTVPTVPFPGAHFAVYPPELIRPAIRAASAVGDTILDPFSGSGTTGMVARMEGRNYIGIDLNREYLDLSLRTRFAQPVMQIWDGGAA